MTGVLVSLRHALRDGDLVELTSPGIEAGDLAPARLDGGGFVRPSRAQGRLARLAGSGGDQGTERLFQLLDADDESTAIEIDPAHYADGGLRLRRWSDRFLTSSDEEVALENGIRAVIAGTAFEPGDYWQYEARAGMPGPQAAGDGAPHGPERLFTPLALLDQSAAGEPMTLVSWLDSRFPHLCEIEADDVSYDGARVGAEAETVQLALDALFLREGGGEGCETPVPLDRDLRDAFDAIPDGSAAKLCLAPGRRAIPGLVQVENKGHITLTGAGDGSLLVGPRTVLEVRNCESVTLSDFAIEATGGTSGAVIRVNNCPKVTIRNVTVRTRERASHGAAVIRLSGSSRNILRKAVIEDCRIEMAHDDTGILIVNADESLVRDNDVRARDGEFDIEAAMAENGFASLVGRVFLSQLALLGEDAALAGNLGDGFSDAGRRIVTLGNWGENMTLRFSTHQTLEPEFWSAIARANPHEPALDNQQAHMRGLIRRTRRGIARFAFGLDPDRATVPDVHRDAVIRLGDSIRISARRVTGHAGIIIAAPDADMLVQSGDVAGAIRGTIGPATTLVGNTVVGCHQGIHVGSASRRTSSDGPKQIFEDVQIDGNRITVDPVIYARSRWGVFVGNAACVSVRNNRISTLSGLARSQIDGIRVWGVYGAHVQIERNACFLTSDGVRFQPINPAELSRKGFVWKISDSERDDAGARRLRPTNAYRGRGSAEITHETPR